MVNQLSATVVSSIRGERRRRTMPGTARKQIATIATNGTSGVGNRNSAGTIASIVGYAPAYHPRFLVLVKIDHPRDTLWGSMAAAPVLRHIFQELFMYYRIPPNPAAVNK